MPIVRPPIVRSIRASAPPALAALALVAAATALPAQRPVPEPAARRPPGPESVAAVRTGPAEVTIRWTPVEGASAYEIGRHAPPNGWQRAGRVAAGQTEFRDAGRDLAVPHLYRVVALVGVLASLPTTSDTVGGPPGAAGDTPGDAAPAGGPGAPGADPKGARGECSREARRQVICRSGSVDWAAGRGTSVQAEVGCPAGFQGISGGSSGNTPFGVRSEYPQGAWGNFRWTVSVAPLWGDGPVPDALRDAVARRPGGYVEAIIVCQRLP